MIKARKSIRVITLLLFLACGAFVLDSCSNSKRGMKVKSSNKIGNPGDKNRHVWGK